MIVFRKISALFFCLSSYLRFGDNDFEGSTCIAYIDVYNKIGCRYCFFIFSDVNIQY